MDEVKKAPIITKVTEDVSYTIEHGGKKFLATKAGGVVTLIPKPSANGNMVRGRDVTGTRYTVSSCDSELDKLHSRIKEIESEIKHQNEILALIDKIESLEPTRVILTESNS